MYTFGVATTNENELDSLSEFSAYRNANSLAEGRGLLFIKKVTAVSAKKNAN